MRYALLSPFNSLSLFRSNKFCYPIRNIEMRIQYFQILLFFPGGKKIVVYQLDGVIFLISVLCFTRAGGKHARWKLN